MAVRCRPTATMSGPPSQPPPLAQGQHPHPPQPQLAPGQQQLEAALLGLFQSLTELQTVAGSVVPGSEALVSSAACIPLPAPVRPSAASSRTSS